MDMSMVIHGHGHGSGFVGVLADSLAGKRQSDIDSAGPWRPDRQVLLTARHLDGRMNASASSVIQNELAKHLAWRRRSVPFPDLWLDVSRLM
jgi:hypothetical protein